MRFAGLKNIFEICLQLQLAACWGDVIMTSSWQLEVKMKAKNVFETGKWIYAEILWNMAIWWSSYGTIHLRYGCFGIEPHLALVLKKIWPGQVFLDFLFVIFIAPIRWFHRNQAWFWPIEGACKAAAPKNSFQVGNFTERGNGQIAPRGGRAKCENSNI